VEKVTFRKQAKHGKHIYIFVTKIKKDKKKEQNYKKEKKNYFLRKKVLIASLLKKYERFLEKKNGLGSRHLRRL
jgi:hypothetical protein